MHNRISAVHKKYYPQIENKFIACMYKIIMNKFYFPTNLMATDFHNDLPTYFIFPKVYEGPKMPYEVMTDFARQAYDGYDQRQKIYYSIQKKFFKKRKLSLRLCMLPN